MSVAAIDFTYRYPFASGMSDSDHGLGLSLATCGRSHERPYFFDGRIREPLVVGYLLLAEGERASEGEKVP